MSFSFLTSCFSFQDLKCHFLKSHVNPGFPAHTPTRDPVFSPASKMLCVPSLSSLALETWCETMSPQKLRPNGMKDTRIFSITLHSDGQRPEDVAFPPGLSLASQSVSLPDDRASRHAWWVSPSARLGEEPFQKSSNSRQTWGRLPAQRFTSASPLLNKAELWVLVLETASAFMGGKCNVFFHHGLWDCLRAERVNKISDSANVLKQAFF